MYSIEDTPLNNIAFGWTLDAASEPHSSVSDAYVTAQVAGQDGDLNLRGWSNSGSMALTMRVWSDASLEKLRHRVRTGSHVSLTADPSIAIVYRRSTVAVTTLMGPNVDPRGGLYKVVIMLELPEVYWRDVDPVTTAAQNITDSGGQVLVFPEFAGTSGPIRDALVLMRGPMGNPTTGISVNGAHGSYFNYIGTLTHAQFLLFDASTGRAWLMPSAVWSPIGTEVTGQIQNGPGPYFFELDPGGSPDSRRVQISVYPHAIGGSLGSGTSALQIQARGAYER